jgi:myo-inositol 2-dehydrogenase / D-chiro-inositol 1-dehydrogenase
VTENFGEIPLPRRFGFEEEDRLFVNAVLSGTAPPVTAFDGYRAVELVAACYRSASENQPVRICG